MGLQREREKTWSPGLMNWLMSAQVRDEGVGGARSLLGWVLLSTVLHAWDYEMNNTTGVWYKGWVSEKVKEVILCWFREVGEMSEWGGWVMSNVIWRKRAKNEGKNSVKPLLKRERSQIIERVQRSEIWCDYTLHQRSEIWCDYTLHRLPHSWT